MEILQSHWHQILFAIGVIIMAVRLESEVKSIRKDLNHLTKEIERRDSYVEVVKLRTEVDQNSKQVSALWQMANNLRDRFNGK
tara:strand:- start:46 stop:294 length:249 start_codon:yes stop_codon:yes gene_type:complete